MTVLASAVKVHGTPANAKAGIVSVSGGRLNVRSGSSTGASVVTSLEKGSDVTLISKSGSWWYVEYANGRYGYCHADYITQVSSSPATVQVSSGSLNVRSGAGTSHTRTGSLSKGERVLVLSTAGGWSRILYHGTSTGYVSAGYLSSSGGSEAAYGAVSLDVPSFQQTDSRWANTQIGSSGKTFSQIGCATTAVAMMESYRGGTIIYPDAMSRKLSYTASGSLYWPEDYVAVSGNSGYLSAIYEKLKAGKPVLFGAKNQSGGQHWVVVTGFHGGSLNAANFTIHDPGSNSRTNLQQLLNGYPIFYKFFYYT